MAEPLPAHVVCLVDDDSSIRKSVSRLLDSAGYGVLAFNEPQVFLDHLATHSVPVVVLDIWMAGMTGMELLAHLCARSPQTRAIFITGQEDHAAEVTVMQAGAFAFLLKPLDAELFLNAIQRAFECERLGVEPPAIAKAG
jgi:two-component system, LuxR family, response regulator FixJ